MLNVLRVGAPMGVALLLLLVEWVKRLRVGVGLEKVAEEEVPGFSPTIGIHTAPLHKQNLSMESYLH